MEEKEIYYEVKTILTPIRVEMSCYCGGKFETTGFVFASSPPIYEHECTYCARKRNFKEAYPKTEFIKTGKEYIPKEN